MASGRMVKNKISTSERVNTLPIPARLLYTWMITHLDREGRMSGNPNIIKQTVIPLTGYSVKQVDQWLDEMESLKSPTTGLGLVCRYEVGGIKYLWMPGFESEQGKGRDGKEPAWKSREAPSGFPPPPGYESPAKDTGIHEVAGVPVSSDNIIDEKFATIAKTYEQNIGILTPMISQRLQSVCDDYPEGWFEKAVEEAVAHNKRNLKYIEKILENWKTDGVNVSGNSVKSGKEASGRKLQYQE